MLTNLQISKPSQDVQSMDNITNEKTSEDIINFNLPHPQPVVVPRSGYSRADVAGIISGFLEEE